MKKDFESRFMPNVKFRFDSDEEGAEYFLNLFGNNLLGGGVYFFTIDKDGKALAITDSSLYDSLKCKEVSLYEVCPDAIPNGMEFHKDGGFVYVKEEKNFTTRFMPNVKFKVPKELEGMAIRHENGSIKILLKQCAIDKNYVLLSAIIDDVFYVSLDVKEVSIYEAISELIPDGMRYNKELDKLVPDVLNISKEDANTIFNKVLKSTPDIIGAGVENTQSKWQRVNNGSNYIAPDGSSFDTLQESLKYTREDFYSEEDGQKILNQIFENNNLGIDLKNHRAYNVGSSNYASMNIQPWDIWKDWKLDPWDADIVKRISRTKEIPGKTFEEARIEDYEKIKHICDEKISQLKEVKNAN